MADDAADKNFRAVVRADLGTDRRVRCKCRNRIDLWSLAGMEGGKAGPNRILKIRIGRRAGFRKVAPGLRFLNPTDLSLVLAYKAREQHGSSESE